MPEEQITVVIHGAPRNVVRQANRVFEPRDFPNFKFFREDCRAYFRRARDADFDYAAHLAAMVGGRTRNGNSPASLGVDSNACGSNEQPLSRCLPAPADRESQKSALSFTARLR